MMRVRNLHAGYGRSQVLHGVDLDLHPGEIVALLGRNGAGRTTLARALMGLVGWRGELHWNGRSLAGVPTHLLARLGLGYVPESRDVFADLTVHQNLLLGFKPGAAAPAAGSGWSMRDVLDMFPALQGRLHVAAGLLSGGEQQMLTLGRALLGNPQLMLVDEPAEGLAPQVIVQVANCLQTLRARGVAVLLIEQKLDLALTISDRCLVMGQGRIVWSGAATGLRDQPAIQQEWLAV